MHEASCTLAFTCVRPRTLKYRGLNRSYSPVCVTPDRTVRERISASKLRKSRRKFAARGGLRMDQHEILCIHIGANASRYFSTVHLQFAAAAEASCLVRTSIASCQRG